MHPCIGIQRVHNGCRLHRMHRSSPRRWRQLTQYWWSRMGASRLAAADDADDAAGASLDVGSSTGVGGSLTVPVSRLAAADGSSSMACLFAASHVVGSGAGVGCSLARCHAALQRGPCARVTPAELPHDELHVRQQAAKPVAAGRPQTLIHRRLVSPRRCRGERLRCKPFAAGGRMRGRGMSWPAKGIVPSWSHAAEPVRTESER